MIDVDMAARKFPLVMEVRSLLPQLLGPQLKSLDFTSLRLVADKHLMSSLYAAMAEACPNLERLAMGQSFFFYPQLVADLNKRLEKFTKVRQWHGVFSQ
jgi:hypothetical protein